MNHKGFPRFNFFSNGLLEGDPLATRVFMRFLDWAPGDSAKEVSKETIEEDEAILQWYKDWNASTPEGSQDDGLGEDDLDEGGAEEDPL